MTLDDLRLFEKNHSGVLLSDEMAQSSNWAVMKKNEALMVS